MPVLLRLLTVVCLGIALAAPAAASADHHLMRIREVYGGGATPVGDYLELQMYRSRQNRVKDHELLFLNADGSVNHSFIFPSQVPNGENQRTVLTGAADAGGSPDFVDPSLNMARAGGAVCFVSHQFFIHALDCVSWGSFSGSLPSPNLAPAPAMTAGVALRLSIARACPTLFEGGDDTDNPAVDFELVSPLPRNNASTPTEVPCPDTTIDSGPSGDTHDRTPTFTFRSIPDGAAFQCKLDAAAFTACTTPHTLPRQPFGTHAFKVRAVQGKAVDRSAASRTFNVIPR